MIGALFDDATSRIEKTEESLAAAADEFEDEELFSLSFLRRMAQTKIRAKRATEGLNTLLQETGDEDGKLKLRSTMLQPLIRSLGSAISKWSSVKSHLRYSPRGELSTEVSRFEVSRKGLRQILSNLRRGRHTLQSNRALWTQEEFPSPSGPALLDNSILDFLPSARDVSHSSSGQARGEAKPRFYAAEAESVEVLVPGPRVPILAPSGRLALETRSSVVNFAELKRLREFPVWYGTNRDSLVDDSDSVEPAEYLRRGVASVYIPKSHKFGETGNGWRKVLARVLLGRDERLEVKKVVPLERASFLSQAANYLQQAQDRSALVVVHGYNVTFDEALIRSAQIGFDLGVGGLTASFCWQSRGRVLGYMADGEGAQIAVPYLIDFLNELATVQGIEEIHLLAHSMGNRVVWGAIQELNAARKSGELGVPIGQLILAAADIAPQLFLQRKAAYRELVTRRITSYCCTRDLPLRASRRGNVRRRVGLEPPTFTWEGMDTVSTGDLDIHGLGHSYYAETAALLYDMREILMHDMPPERRTRIEEAASADAEYWAFRR